METSQSTYSIISFNELSGQKRSLVIENFIISDRRTADLQLELNQPCILEGMAFIICLQGKGKIKLDPKEWEIEKNMVISVFHGKTIEFLERSYDLSIEFVITSLDFISDLRIPLQGNMISQIGQMPCLKLKKEQMDILMEFHIFITRHYNRTNHQYRVQISKNLLASFLIEIISLYQSATPVINIPPIGRKEEIMKSFFSLLKKYHKTERSLAFYTDKMCMTAQYMAKVIKEVTQKGATEWINGITIITIKAYLKTSNLTVSQISEELNFPNPSFFGRYFKKHTGLTPMQYRES
ncbi:MAG: helix-turn-helix domain-containing protein [Tannerellaceae bacterium]|nr:helix-turn-helix domain-containing protein [Tannerellaceae bacterium]